MEKSFKAGDKIESEALSAANGTLATLYDMSQLTFRMAVNELDINKVAVGQRVEITTEALSGQIFTGTVDKVNINGTTTNGFTTYPITVRLDGDGTELARQGAVSEKTVFPEASCTVMVLPAAMETAEEAFGMLPEEISGCCCV